MKLDKDLKTMSVSDLLVCFEEDILNGCHSTRMEADRSLAGRELQQRGKEALEAITARLKVSLSENQLQPKVHNGLALVLYEMTQVTLSV